MKPNAQHLIRWYKDLLMVYRRVPSSRLLLFGEYLRDLSVEEFQEVMDAVKDAHVRVLRRNSVGGIYGN